MRRPAARVETITWARLALLVGVFVVFAISDRRFAAANNIFTIFEGFAWLGLAALAVGLTIIAGELDLSVGSVAAVAGSLPFPWSRTSAWSRRWWWRPSSASRSGPPRDT